MITFLIILGSIIVFFVGAVVISIYNSAPKNFRGKLKPLEKAIFRALEQNLPEPVKSLVPRQLSKLKSGCRYFFPKSYTLELYEDKSDNIEDEYLFRRTDEFKLATLGFTIGIEKYKAEFKTYDGHICGFTIRPRPSLGFYKFEQVSFKLNNDPMEELDLAIKAEYYDPNETFTGLLGELKKKYDLQSVLKPLPDKQRELYTRLSETKLPQDYLELLKQTNGFLMEQVSVFGLGSLNPVPMDAGIYLTLAESGIGAISVKQTTRTTKLKHFTFEDATDAKNCGEEFIPALERFIELSK